MSLPQIFAGVAVDNALPHVMIHGITHDSRQVEPDYLFVALDGEHLRGADFVPHAVSRGAVALAGALPPRQEQPLPSFPLPAPRPAYSRLAANYYGHPSRRMIVVGITGTNGKTTSAHILAAIFQAQGGSATVLGTLGVLILGGQDAGPPRYRGTSLTTPEADLIHKLLSELEQAGAGPVVMEVSSHALVQHRVDDVDFDAALFTNLSREHLDYHGDMDTYLAAKLRLFHLLRPDRPAVVNLDDPLGKTFVAAAPGPLLTYSLGPPAPFPGSRPNAPQPPGTETALWVTHMNVTLQGTKAELSYNDERFPIASRLVGRYNLSNILAAAAAALALDVPIAAIQRGIQALTYVPGRLERISYAGPGTVFIDYAHTPAGYAQVLGTIRELAPPDARIITLFGCGGNRDQAKRPLMAAQAETYSQHLIVTSDNPRTENPDRIFEHILSGLKSDRHEVIKDRKKAVLHALGMMTAGSILMILGKGREQYQIIGTRKVTHDDIELVETFQR